MVGPVGHFAQIYPPTAEMFENMLRSNNYNMSAFAHPESIFTHYLVKPCTEKVVIREGKPQFESYTV